MEGTLFFKPKQHTIHDLDIFHYNRSLKAGWVKRYLDTHTQGKLKHLLQDKLQKYKNNLSLNHTLLIKTYIYYIKMKLMILYQHGQI